MKAGTLVVLGIVGIAGYGIYKNWYLKQAAIITIKANRKAYTDLFVNRDTDYLIAWAQAIKSGAAYFKWNGRNWLTDGGQAFI